MADPQALSTTRPDMDIHQDVHNLILHYPPLAADLHQIHIVVSDGVVNVSGHVKSQPSRRTLLDLIPTIEGVKGVNGDSLYDEDTLRREVGRVIPIGIQVTMRYGTVILTGGFPEETTPEDSFALLTKIPGVEKVVTQF